MDDVFVCIRQFLFITFGILFLYRNNLEKLVPLTLLSEVF
jgi:hypothetical protein